MSSGYVYLFKCDNEYKIGHSKNVIQRFNQIARTEEADLEMIFVCHVENMEVTERALHVVFYDKRNWPTEWFRLEDEDINIIKYYLSEIGNVFFDQSEYCNLIAEIASLSTVC